MPTDLCSAPKDLTVTYKQHLHIRYCLLTYTCVSQNCLEKKEKKGGRRKKERKVEDGDESGGMDESARTKHRRNSDFVDACRNEQV